MAAAISGDVAPALDYRSFALKRAGKLGVFASPPSVFEDAFTEKAGNAPSRWKTTFVGTGAVSILSDVPGGAMRLDSAATGSSVATATMGLGTDIPSVIPDPGLTGAFWYALWVFRIPTTVDTQTFGFVEFFKAASAGTNSLYFGVDGRFVSATKFCLEDNSTSTQSSVTVDTGWHFGEIWQTGTARVVQFAFDGEAPKSMTMTANIGGPAVPRFTSANGTTAASRQLDSDHLIVLMPSNVTLPAT